MSEPKSGSPQSHFKNRASQIQSTFRRCSLWVFWKLDWLTKHNLFHFNLRNLFQRGQGDSSSSTKHDKEADLYKRKYGSVIPKNIPERSLFVMSSAYHKRYISPLTPTLISSPSTCTLTAWRGNTKKYMTSSAWWREQNKDLFALTEPHELGMMSCMITITHNDYVPELLANIRRGPFAMPTEEEKLEYLLTHQPAKKKRCDFENYSMEHVLSHQRRVAATKQNFMQRGKRTPLGIIKEWWDRTEAQMRAALHEHILGFFKRREPPPDY